jgi:hypothetical protein
MEALSDLQCEALQGGFFSIQVSPRLITRVSPQVAPVVAPIISTDVAVVETNQLNLAVPTAVGVLGGRAESNVSSMVNMLSLRIRS